jgi:hypothetical protein
MLDTEIREQIRRYIAGRIDAGDLEAWLSADAEDGLDDASQATRDLVYETARLVYERMNGDWTDSELKTKLGSLSRTFWLRAAPAVVLSSSSEVIRRDDRVPGAVGTSLEAEFV